LPSARRRGMLVGMKQNPYKSPVQHGKRASNRWLALMAIVVIGGLLGLSALRLSEATQNGSEATIRRGRIACGVLAPAFIVALFMLRRR